MPDNILIRLKPRQEEETMDETQTDNVIQHSTDYSKFRLMDANRELSKGHVEALKAEFEESGNLTRVQPILVNENFFIVDGQHRFQATQELGLPVYYTVVPGLTIANARKMNATQRPWRVDDYAKSYAYTGHKVYRQYLDLREMYEVGHSIVMAFIYARDKSGMYKDFRTGQLVIEDLDHTKKNLDNFTELRELLPIGASKELAYSLQKLFDNPNYSQKRMVSKAKLYADRFIRRFATEAEYLRAFEDLYNYGNSEESRVRLF